jgi:hypothetical protein
MDDLDIYEKSLLDDLRSDYEGELLQVFPTEFDIAQRLLDKGYITRDVDSDDTVWFVRPVEENNFNLRGFKKISDREIYIELDDGTEVTIKALTRYVYDENEGYIDEPYLEVKVD